MLGSLDGDAHPVLPLLRVKEQICSALSSDLSSTRLEAARLRPTVFLNCDHPKLLRKRYDILTKKVRPLRRKPGSN